MKLTLGSNAVPLQIARRLDATSESLRSSFERLSTGNKTNNASDDSAGLALAGSLQLDGRVFERAVRNINDAIALVNVADSALQTLSGITVRLTELGQQASNGALAQAQREALDKEARALRDEYARIVRVTEFNERKVLNGALGTFSIQAGYSSIAGSFGGMSPSGEFEDAQTTLLGVGAISDVIGADLDGDGIEDLVLSNIGGNALRLYFGNGDGTFRNGFGLGVTSPPYEITFGDFSGDGHLDIAAVSTDGDVFIAPGFGDGIFGLAMRFAAPAGAQAIAVGDFDGDGNDDIAFTGGLGVHVRLGLGDGSFGPSSSTGAGVGPRSLAIGDVNGDGILDIVAGNTDDQVRVLIGAGDGSFTASGSFTAGNRIEDVKLADLDNDGTLDIITADHSDSTMSVLLGNGDGSFQAGTTYATTGQTYSVEVGDFNGDGVPDVVTSDNNSSMASLFFGKGDGTFDSPEQLSVGLTARGAHIGDFNGDGVQDLAFAGGLGMSILLGKGQAGTPQIGEFSLVTQAGARNAVGMFTKLSDRLSDLRAAFGAYGSRIEHTIKTLSEVNVGIRAAENVITDVDVADEMSKTMRLNILQQSGVALLAQANQQQSVVLNLLN